MKIGIDARMYGKAQSGIGNYLLQLTDQLFQLDKLNDYYLFLLEPVFSQYQIPHSKIHKIKVAAPWYSYAEQTKFLATLNYYHLDLMHFPHFNAPIFYQGKRLTTIHDLTPLFFPGHKQKSWWRKKAYFWTLKTSLSKSVKIITDSQYTKDDIIKHFQLNPDKIEVIYLGLEPDFKIIENYAKIKELTQKYGLQKPYLFFLSVWRNHKNFLGLIKAFEIIKKDYNLDYQLLLGGQEDPHFPDIRQAIDKSPFKNDIVTPGFISEQDLPYLYNGATTFVIPSFYEGFGLMGIEALACGVPVIASKTTSLPEILGSAAIYFNPDDAEQMAAIINQVLTDAQLKADLKAKGLNQIKKYSWQTCGQKTLNLYQQILNQK